MPADTRRILVPGQVEDDLSIRFGGGDIKTNLGAVAGGARRQSRRLHPLQAAPRCRRRPPQGRRPRDRRRAVLRIRVVRDGSTAALLAVVDELHTMTSLAGFEALLRGRGVDRVRAAVLCRLGADDRPGADRSRPPAEPGGTGGRRPDPLSALSRPADPAAVRAGGHHRAARPPRIVAAGPAGYGAAAARRGDGAARAIARDYCRPAVRPARRLPD